MVRESTKHNSRADERLAAEAAAHLRALPPDLTFDDPASVAIALGGIHSDK